MTRFLTVLVLMFAAMPLFAGSGIPQEADSHIGMYALYFLAMGIATLGCTLGQSKVAAATIEGIARNPGTMKNLLVVMILAFALMESLVIFTMITLYLV